MKNIFISGISSGLGLGLTQYYLNQGHSVYGVSRRPCPITHPKLKHSKLNLIDYQSYENVLKKLTCNVSLFDLIILNAGILGDLTEIKNSTIENMKSVMDINLWSQKALIDFFLQNKPKIHHILAISSGVTTDVNTGWSSYWLSKIALNSLINLYAKENPDVLFHSIAPGLIETPMLKSILSKSNENLPSLEYIKNQKENGLILSPYQFAEKLDALSETIQQFPSGSFVDKLLLL
ncbi:MAG: SDR family NAD(P)-dependent oxidoreductase [Halobacteriovoraceae bacterium]|nr:SDR family NAD(P)-dependent oxidoreductase [Halobacteriovoraceae bacterium]MCB9095557.1 SDR family NAD(P)-dependent oxidoreductase [Halobacteriovoraceae bacterium]